MNDKKYSIAKQRNTFPSASYTESALEVAECTQDQVAN